MTQNLVLHEEPTGRILRLLTSVDFTYLLSNYYRVLICTYHYLRMYLCYMASKGLNFIFHFSLSMTSWPAKFPGVEWCRVRQTAGVWTEEWETRGGREERRRRERRKSGGNYIQSSRYTGVHLEREGGREGGEREREEGRGEREGGRERGRKGGGRERERGRGERERERERGKRERGRESMGIYSTM